MALASTPPLPLMSCCAAGVDESMACVVFPVACAAVVNDGRDGDRMSSRAYVQVEAAKWHCRRRAASCFVLIFEHTRMRPTKFPAPQWHSARAVLSQWVKASARTHPKAVAFFGELLT
eukprot:366503-Chlamydomonas_euryale.AAC.8